jgi:probable HAF family extracellular repeat protein
MKRHPHRLVVRTALAIATALCLIGAQAAPPRYKLTDLGDGVQPFKINNKGQIVGQKLFDTYGKQFVYSRGTMTFLEPPVGYDFIAVRSINDSGQMVGDVGNASGGRPFILSHGAMTLLEVLEGQDQSYAVDINNAGQVVGSATKEGVYGYRGWLYSAGRMVDVGTIRDHEHVFPEAINGAGSVVGTSHRSDWPPEYHAFLYSAGTMQDVGWGSGVDINDAGQVVGNTHARGAFIYNRGTTKFLPALEGSERRNTRASAINNAGEVVGTAGFLFASDNRGRAFIYSQGKMFDLNKLTDRRQGLELVWAIDINNAGSIVGYARKGVGESFRGFLLTPIPEAAVP